VTRTDFVIRGERVQTREALSRAAIHIKGGVIDAVTSYGDVPAGCEIVEAPEGSVAFPGLVDTHVHVNEPGRTEWEGFTTATRAAAAGGVTTLIDMPLNSIPATTTLGHLETKIESAKDKCWVDVGFWAGVVPGNAAELAGLFEAGVFGFKCFLVHSGVDEFPNVAEKDLRIALPELVRLGALLILHAELPAPIDRALGDIATRADPTYYWTFLHSRPRGAEDEAVAMIARLSHEYGARLHVVHHSSSDSLELLRDARAAGVPVSVETCPHYLYFASEEIPRGSTEFKCCPPIRERENREKLWKALGDGVIDMIVSDHSPCPPEMKHRETGNFLKAWGGISSLQLRLPIAWTAARERGYSIERLSQWLCGGPAELVGLDGHKGAIAAGYDADLTIWSPDKQFQVKPAGIHHRHKLTPYIGRTLSGVVHSTYLRGERIYHNGDFGSEPSGVMLKRGRR
jgi:allantoinase